MLFLFTIYTRYLYFRKNIKDKNISMNNKQLKVLVKIKPQIAT